MQAPNIVSRARIGKNRFGTISCLKSARVLEQRLLGSIFDGKSIKHQALEIARRDHLYFKVSNRWFRRFLNRSNFVLRWTTTSELQRNCSRLINKCNKCKLDLANAEHSSIINIDETSIYLDASSK